MTFSSIGICDVSRKSLEWILTKQGTGNAAVIAVGGAEEALESRPGVYRLTLKNRKGFVKAAIRTGFVARRVENLRNLDNAYNSCTSRISQPIHAVADPGFPVGGASTS